MRVANRVLKLERTLGQRGLTVMDRFQRALDQSAFRIAGTTMAAVARDAPEFDRILEDVNISFARQLSEPDRNSLITELERIVSASEGSRR
jgi:hypothetical protein